MCILAIEGHQEKIQKKNTRIGAIDSLIGPELIK